MYHSTVFTYLNPNSSDDNHSSEQSPLHWQLSGDINSSIAPTYFCYSFQEHDHWESPVCEASAHMRLCRKGFYSPFCHLTSSAKGNLDQAHLSHAASHQIVFTFKESLKINRTGNTEARHISKYLLEAVDSEWPPNASTVRKLWEAKQSLGTRYYGAPSCKSVLLLQKKPHLTHLLMQPKCRGQAVKTRHMQYQAKKKNTLRGLALRTVIHIKSQKSFSVASYHGASCIFTGNFKEVHQKKKKSFFPPDFYKTI